MGEAKTGVQPEKPFAERLKALIEQSSLSHRSIAAAIGVSKQSVTNWTQGHNEPSLGHLRKIAQALDVSLADLLEGPAPSAAQERSLAVDLLAELVSTPAAPAVRELSKSAPGFLDLLARVERHLKEARKS